uniref:Calcium homeostasis modulator protein n=1 Tax=Panagrolaimus sp. JU765 TaxID=591449 RepID=A0AC34R7R1_9BILA
MTTVATAAATAAATSTSISSESGAFSVISGVFKNYGPSVINGLIIVSTISGQSIIGKLTFSCPCSYPLNIYHAITFIFGPSLALFMFALLINPKTWKLVHGCCHRTDKAQHPLGVACLYWLQIIAQSGIAPIAWLFVAFLNGSYYTCMRAGSFCGITETTKCENQSVILPETVISIPVILITADPNICPLCVCSLDPVSDGYLRSQSQVIAWALIVGTGLMSLTTICIVRMCDKYTYVQNNYVQMYRDEEKRIFEEIAKEHARTFAEMNSKAFFASPKHSKADWDVISALPSITNPYIFRNRLKKKQLATEVWEYTALQKWINENADKIHPMAVEPPKEAFVRSDNGVNSAPPFIRQGSVDQSK